MVSISLLVPAWNECETISIAILENYTFLMQLQDSELISKFEIVALNDGSDDDTPVILLRLAQTMPQLKIISNANPTGIYDAFNLLYANASMEWVLLIPGDYQWRVDATKVMFQAFLDSGSCKGVLGIRDSKASIYTPSRLFVSKTLGRFADWILETRNSDPGSIKILPNSILAHSFLSKSVLIEIERLFEGKKITKSEILLVNVPWWPRVSGIASGVSRKTLQPILRDVLTISTRKLRGKFSTEAFSVS